MYSIFILMKPDHGYDTSSPEHKSIVNLKTRFNREFEKIGLNLWGVYAPDAEHVTSTFRTIYSLKHIICPDNCEIAVGAYEMFDKRVYKKEQ